MLVLDRQCTCCAVRCELANEKSLARENCLILLGCGELWGVFQSFS